VTLAELIRDHASADTERARAEIELEMWQLYGKDEVRTEKRDRSDYVASVLGVSRYPIAQRQRLLGYGDAFEVLWQRVDDDMMLRTACEIAHTVKKIKARGESEREVLARVLAEYDARPNVYHVNGKIVRRPSWLKAKAQEFTQRERESRAQTPEGRFWTEHRALVRGYVEERLVGQSDMDITNEVERLETDLKVVFAEFHSRLDWKKRRVPLAVAITRRALVEACRTLHLDPPKSTTEAPGEAFFKTAQRRFKELAREYHPDRHGSDATRPQFEAVMEAWRVIQDYREHGFPGSAKGEVK
jgi:hypothetical protein